MGRICTTLWISLLLMLNGIVFLQAAEKPIRIGATVSQEGKYLQPSAMIRKGYELWADQVNKRGGLLGRRVELVFYDDKSREDLAGSLYERLLTKDRVDLVLSPYGTPLTIAASDVTERHKVVMLGSAAAGEKIWERGYQYVFGVYAPAGRYFIGFLDLMARNGLESVGIIFENSPFNRSIEKGVREWAARFGLVVAFCRGFDDPAGEFPVLLNQVMEKKVDGLVFSGYPPECYRFIQMMKEADYRPEAFAITIVPVQTDFREKVGPFAEGVFGPSQWEPDERIPFPGTTQFIRDFKSFSGKMPTYHAGSAYSSCQILEKAVLHAGSIDHQKIRDFVSNLDTATVIGRFKVDHTGRQIGHNPILIQWQDGKKEIVYPAKMSTSPPKFGP